MCMKLTTEMKESIAKTVAALFAGGQSPARHYGIDPDHIERVEVANPIVAKQGVPLTHPLDSMGAI